MAELDTLKKFAEEVETLAKEASGLAELAKKANADLETTKAELDKTASALKEAKEAAPAPLNAERLAKAASAVVKLYGDRATVTTELLEKIWGADHNTIVDSLVKVASDSITKKVQEPGMVSVKKAPVEKKASDNFSVVSPDSVSHRKAFDDIFGIR